MCEKVSYIRDGCAPIPEKEMTSRIMNAIKDKNTKPELLLRKALWHYGIKGYRLHWKKAPGKPDISFPRKKIAIFLNGCFWHRGPLCKPKIPKTHLNFREVKFQKNIERDMTKIKLLLDLNWETLVIWECEINNDLTKCIQRVINMAM
jgi:DNA mismatch endonuclease (patch repair protein)